MSRGQAGKGALRRGSQVGADLPSLPSSSFDNSNLCSGGGDKAVVLWDVASGQVVRKFRGHAGVSTSRKKPHQSVVSGGDPR